MIRAPPKFTAKQNWLEERAVRSFKIAVKKNIADAPKYSRPCREILTHASIDTHHLPHSATGIPPALAMTGRCDISSGYPHTAFNHDPEIAESVMEINNNVRNITNARNAIVFADAHRAVRTMMSRKAPDRPMSHFFWRVGANCDGRILGRYLSGGRGIRQ